ncbi:MAG: LysM peptidoglycan-binding domain-containing protein [Caldilineales bacterium]|nr:LysM peptidoglycan-binding domain-containing protein [Caldilineales bacterium]MDW8317354.1 LysM peptidoglycan-binding domain-containing protein [Anaerolineae bacterium]
MNQPRDRLVPLLLVLIAALLLGACQRERPAPESSNWDVSPVAQPTAPVGTPIPAAQPTTAATTVSVEGAQPGTTPGIIVVPSTPTPVAAPGGLVVVPSGPTFAYTVQAGDTLFGIAVRYNTDVDTLRRLNNLSDDTIQVGQVLQVPGTGPQGGATPAAPTQPTQPAGQQVIYVVEPGDTLSGIAAKFNVAWTDIARANNISAPYTIYRGQKLVIPGVQPTPVPQAPARTHTVQAGETLYGIAVKYGVTVQAIMQANNLTNPDFIRTGQVLVIPGQ